LSVQEPCYYPSENLKLTMPFRPEKKVRNPWRGVETASALERLPGLPIDAVPSEGVCLHLVGPPGSRVYTVPEDVFETRRTAPLSSVRSSGSIHCTQCCGWLVRIEARRLGNSFEALMLLPN